MIIDRKDIELTEYRIEDPEKLLKVIQSFAKEGQLNPILLIRNPQHHYPKYKERIHLPKMIINGEEYAIAAGNQKIFAIDALGIPIVKVKIYDNMNEMRQDRREQNKWYTQETL